MKKALSLVMVLLLTLLMASPLSLAHADEAKTLKVLMSYWNVDLANDPVKKAIEEVTGYTLDVEILPDGLEPELEKLNLLLASGAEYDIVRLFNIANFKLCTKNGYFLALDELLDNYPVVRDASPAALWSQTKLDGKTYGVPLKKNMSGTAIGTIYRADVLDSLGLSVPNTPAEFKAVLEAIKENTGLIPYSISSALMVDNVTSGFGFSYTIPWFEKDGVLVPREKADGFVDFIKFMRELYAEGLLDQEFASNNVESIQQKLVSDKVAIAEFGWWFWQCLATLRENLPQAQVSYLPALKNADGVGVFAATTAGLDACTAIPVSSKKPEAVLDFLSKLLDPAVYDKIYNGEEGVEYEVVDDGYKGTELYAQNKLTSWWWQFASRDDLMAKTFYIGISGESADVSGTFAAQNAAVADSLAYDPQLSMDTSEKFAKYASSLSSLTRDFVIKMITSNEDIDAAYQQFISVWDMEGGLEVAEDINAIYAASK